MSPLSPEPECWETVWHYMQGGPGVFTGDLYFYQVEGDIRGRIGADRHHGLPALSAHRRIRLLGLAARHRSAVAARVKGAKFTVMKGLGHFPMSENPEAFLGYLRPVLDEIRQAGRS